MADPQSDQPGTVSDQNQEEAPSGVGGDRRHREPPTRDPEGEAGKGAERASADDTEGESKEGSQSTGHPQNAG